MRTMSKVLSPAEARRQLELAGAALRSAQRVYDLSSRLAIVTSDCTDTARTWANLTAAREAFKLAKQALTTLTEPQND
jgi:hypothetical protein